MVYGLAWELEIVRECIWWSRKNIMGRPKANGFREALAIYHGSLVVMVGNRWWWKVTAFKS